MLDMQNVYFKAIISSCADLPTSSHFTVAESTNTSSKIVCASLGSMDLRYPEDDSTFLCYQTKVRMATYGGTYSAESPSRGSPKFTFFSVGGCGESLLTGFANMLGDPIFLF